jgi:hypothetical protein
VTRRLAQPAAIKRKPAPTQRRAVFGEGFILRLPYLIRPASALVRHQDSPIHQLVFADRIHAVKPSCIRMIVVTTNTMPTP